MDPCWSIQTKRKDAHRHLQWAPCDAFGCKGRKYYSPGHSKRQQKDPVRPAKAARAGRPWRGARRVRSRGGAPRCASFSAAVAGPGVSQFWGSSGALFGCPGRGVRAVGARAHPAPEARAVELLSSAAASGGGRVGDSMGASTCRHYPVHGNARWIAGTWVHQRSLCKKVLRIRTGRAGAGRPRARAGRAPAAALARRRRRRGRAGEGAGGVQVEQQ
ncbi:MAG: hypothetical protein J3K34DRAFT_432889 [Monoraphidium minutum]|nr:MAG: hypothetical protein J3K34DRAFT_432889 [Monoraphidium minutum]